MSQERLSRLQKQTSRLVQALKEIDNRFVPDNDFINALANALPPSLDSSYPAVAYNDMSAWTADANKNSQTTTSTFGVKIDYNAKQEDTPEEIARKAAQAQMNQLPEWHLHSTISGEHIGPRNTTANQDHNVILGDNSLDAVANDEVAEYYKTLRAQQQAEAEESADDEQDFEEDEAEDEINSTIVKNEPSNTKSEVAEGDGTGQEDTDEEFEDV